MGESMVESPNIETKMGESVGSLEVSISFGRFENDNSLSWEKWSSFSQNKYLEEVEKCSTPGSVAKKKAYFEAHYKKIAARKIEIFEQENQTETDPSTSNDLNCQDHTQNINAEQNTNSIDAIDALSSTVLDEPKKDAVSSSRCDSSLINHSGSDDLNRKDRTENIHVTNQVEQDTNSIDVVSSVLVDEPKEDAVSSLECNSSLVDEGEGIEELNIKLESNEFNVPDKAPLMGSEYNVSEPPKLDSKTEHTPESKDGSSKVDERNISQKITPTRKERNSVGTRKKILESSTPKRLQTSTVRVSKPPPTSNSTPTSRSSIKKANVSPLPRRSKNSSVAPTSLHMSISLGSVNSDSASVNTARTSLIMEKMGDKDVAKRAFKSFQNSLNQQTISSSNEKSQGSKEVAPRGAEQNVSVSTTYRKVNERTRKSTEKINAQKEQLGKTWNSTSSGSIKKASLNGGNVKAASMAIGLKTDERADKRKEFVKKFEEKSHTKESEKSRLSSKAKDEKEMRKLRQSLNFKAKPIPDFYRARGISTKTPSEKEDAKREMSRLPK